MSADTKTARRTEAIEPVRLPLDLTYRHAAGIHFSYFFDKLQNGEIHGVCCSGCGAVYLPPRPFCGRCRRPTGGWQPVGPAGTVRALSEVFLPILDPHTGRNRKVPHTMVLVQLDGTHSLLHQILLEDEPCAIGARVEIVFAEEKTGSMKDILGFRFLANESPGRDDRQPRPFDTANVEIRTIEERIQIPFALSPGEVGAEFLGFLREGRLRAFHCDDCGERNLPPARFCLRCFSRNQAWRDQPHGGTTIGIARLTPEDRAHLPADVFGFALVRLDDMRTAFLHHLIDPELKQGDRAGLIFRKERSGSILDIKGFVSADSGQRKE